MVSKTPEADPVGGRSPGPVSFPHLVYHSTVFLRVGRGPMSSWRVAFRRFALSATATLLPVGSVAGQAADAHYAIENARIVTVSGETIDRGTVVVRDGMIQAVGSNVSTPPGAWVIDGRDVSGGCPAAAYRWPGLRTGRGTEPGRSPSVGGSGGQAGHVHLGFRSGSPGA